MKCPFWDKNVGVRTRLAAAGGGQNRAVRPGGMVSRKRNVSTRRARAGTSTTSPAQAGYPAKPGASILTAAPDPGSPAARRHTPDVAIGVPGRAAPRFVSLLGLDLGLPLTHESGPRRTACQTTTDPRDCLAQGRTSKRPRWQCAWQAGSASRLGALDCAARCRDGSTDNS